MGKDLKGKELGDYLSQRSNGSYMARFTDRFGKRRCHYSTNLKELKAWLNQELYEDKRHLNISDESILLNEWFEKWIAIHKYKTICLNTKRHYIHVFRKHISPVLGMHKLIDINQLMIKDLINKLDANGYQYETKNKVKILLIDMYDKAIGDEFARKNPARGIKIEREECDEEHVRVLDKEEQQIFFECCKGTFYDNLFVVAVNTGLRPGELCALKWDDIDFEKNEISVTKTLVYQKLEGDEKKTFHFDPPKTKKSKRSVPINKAASVALKKQKLQSEVVKSKSSKFKDVPEEFQDLLFTTKYGTPINAVIYNDAIKKIIEEINLMRDPLEVYEDFSAHCFRHTFATRCFESGVQPKTVQKILGHATLKMTMDLYTHVLDDKKKEEMEKFDNYMTQLDEINVETQEKYLDQKINDLNTKSNIILLENVI